MKYRGVIPEYHGDTVAFNLMTHNEKKKKKKKKKEKKKKKKKKIYLSVLVRIFIEPGDAGFAGKRRNDAI